MLHGSFQFSSPHAWQCIVKQRDISLLFHFNSTLRLDTIFSSGFCDYFPAWSYVPCCCQWFKKKCLLVSWKLVQIQILHHIPQSSMLILVNRIFIVWEWNGGFSSLGGHFCFLMNPRFCCGGRCFFRGKL